MRRRAERRPVLYGVFDARYAVDPDRAACLAVEGCAADARRAQAEADCGGVIVKLRRRPDGKYEDAGVIA